MRTLTNLLGTLVVLAAIAVPVVVAQRQLLETRHFGVVCPGVLYRSGQLTLDGLKQVVHEHGIRTVISLRSGQTPEEKTEEEYCQREAIAFVRLPPRAWSDGKGGAPVEENVRRFRELVADPANHPILIHCFAGTHRTGAYCAIYRMEFEGWSNARALNEVKAFGYENLEKELDILGYLGAYRPRGR